MLGCVLDVPLQKSDCVMDLGLGELINSLIVFANLRQCFLLLAFNILIDILSEYL